MLTCARTLPLTMGLLAISLLTAMAVAAADPREGTTAPAYKNAELGITLTSPAECDPPVVFRSRGFKWSGHPEGTICEWEEDPRGPHRFKGWLVHHEKGLSAADYAKWREAEHQKRPEIKELKMVAERKLDLKPGEWLSREYLAFCGELGTLRYFHVYAAVGKHNYELIASCNANLPGTTRVFREDTVAMAGQLRLPGGDQPEIAVAPANRVSQPPVAVGPQPVTKPAGAGAKKGVAGIAYVAHLGKGHGYEIMVLADGAKEPVNVSNDPGPDYDPAWSPDGTRIAFVSGRGANARRVDSMTDGIYVMDADGKNVIRVTVGDDRTARNPCWSPDGTKIAYSSEKDIWVVNADGSNRDKPTNLTHSADEEGWPAWSPDGSKIAFSSSREGGLWVMNPDGTGQANLTKETRLNPVQPRWSADGRQIIFMDLRSGGLDPTTAGRGPTMIMNADGTDIRRNTWPGAITETVPQFFPKSNKIAFIAATHDDEMIEGSRGPDVYIKNVNGVHRVKITSGGAWDFDISPLAADEPLEVKVEGDILFSRFAALHATFDVYVMSEDAKKKTNLSQTASPKAEEQPRWSPGKKKIAFAAERELRDPRTRAPLAGGRTNIHVMDADGSNVVNLTGHHGTECYPAWSPDGARIAFLRTVEGGFALFIMNADGTEVRQLGFHGELASKFTWSPDGAQIIFGHHLLPDGHMVMRTVNTVGEPKPAPFTVRAQGGYDPDWDPVSNRIAYFGTAPNAKGEVKLGLRIFNPATGADMLVTDKPEELNGNGAGHPTWAPDGKRLAYHRRDGQSDICIIHEDGTGWVNVTKGGQNLYPHWGVEPYKGPTAPPIAGTGCILVLLHEDGKGNVVARVDTDGKILKVLRTIPNGGEYDGIVWSPDKTRIVVEATQPGNKKGHPGRAGGEGRAARAGTGDLSFLFTRRQADRVHPFIRRQCRGFIFVDVEGTAAPRRREGADAHDSPDLCWSPDSKRILVRSQLYGDSALGKNGQSVLSIVEADSGKLTKLAIPQDEEFFESGKWSPDGRQIVCTRTPTSGANATSETWLMNGDGTGARKLLAGFGPARMDCWLPDNKTFLVWPKPGKGGILAASVDGGAPKQILGEGFMMCRLSPDGKRLLAMRTSPTERPSLYVANIDGTNLKRVGNLSVLAFAWCDPAAAPAGGVPRGRNGP